MKKTKYKFGLPVLDFLDISFCNEYYRKMFFSSILSVEDIEKIFHKIISLKDDKESITTYFEELKTKIDEFFDFQEDEKKELRISKKSEEYKFLLNKIKSWVDSYVEITDAEIEEYIKFHNLRQIEAFTILKKRKQKWLSSPKKIKEQLDKYVIGQENAKQVLSFGFYLHAIRNGFVKPVIHSMMNFPTSINERSLPRPNVLLIGPTGSGKSHIVNSLCKIFNIPYLKINCSSLTSSGYVGNNIDDYFRNLLDRYDDLAENAIIHFDEFDKMSEINYGREGSVGGIELQQEFLTLLEEGHRVLKGKGNEKEKTIDTSNMMFVFSGSFVGIEKVIYSRINKEDIDSKIQQKKKERNKTLKIWEELAKRKTNLGFKVYDEKTENVNPNSKIENLLREIEIEKVRDFIHKMDEKSILEDLNIDKEDKEKLLQNVTYEDIVKFGIIPELVGRVGMITVLDSLDKEQIISLMKNAKSSILKQYEYFFNVHYDKLIIEEDVYDLIAERVLERKLGARGLNSILLHLIQDFLFLAPNESQETFTIDKKYFNQRFQ